MRVDLNRSGAILLLAIPLLARPVSAETIVLTLDEPTVPAELQCGDTWSEEGLELTVLPTDQDICGLELCTFSRLPDQFGLGGSFLNVDLTSIPGSVISAVVLMQSVCDCFAATFYNGETIVHRVFGGLPPRFNHPDTLTLFTSGMAVDRLTVEPCVDTSVWEIRIEFSPTPTSTGPLVDAREMSLDSQPNPFRDAIRISFNLQVDEPLQLLIYDVRGRVVRSLVTSEFVAGRWNTSWNGRDAFGRRLAPGVYFAGVSVSGRVVAVQRIVMVK